MIPIEYTALNAVLSLDDSARQLKNQMWFPVTPITLVADDDSPIGYHIWSVVTLAWVQANLALRIMIAGSLFERSLVDCQLY